MGLQDVSKNEVGVPIEGDLFAHHNLAKTSGREGISGLNGTTALASKAGKSEEQGSGGQIKMPKESYEASSKAAGFNQESSIHQVAPEDLSILYTDPQGEVQGPFLGVDIIGWFEAGFFGLDLPVRLMDAPEGTPFTALENIMPHLKPAVKVPPGFTSSLKQLEEGGESIHMKAEGISSIISSRLPESLSVDNEMERGGGVLEPSSDIDLLGLTGDSKKVFGNEFQVGLNGKIASSKSGKCFESEIFFEFRRGIWCLCEYHSVYRSLSFCRRFVHVIMQLRVSVVVSEMLVDKVFGRGNTELGVKAEEANDQSHSIRKRMSAFSRMDAEVSETGNVGLPNLFPKNEGPTSLPGMS